MGVGGWSWSELGYVLVGPRGVEGVARGALVLVGAGNKPRRGMRVGGMVLKGAGVLGALILVGAVPHAGAGGEVLPGPGYEVGRSWQGARAGRCSVPAGGLASSTWCCRYCGGGLTRMASSGASSWQLLFSMAQARRLQYCNHCCRCCG